MMACKAPGSTITASVVLAVIRPITDSIVGWSNKSVCGNSITNKLLSVLANSVAAIESSPEVIIGEFMAMAVPRTSRTNAEMFAATDE